MFIQKDSEELYDANVKGFMVLLAVTVALAFGKLIGAWPGLSWWWVTMPLWFPYAIMLGFLAVFLVLVILALIAGGFFGLLAGISQISGRERKDGE